MNYEDVSDFEINKKLAELEGLEFHVSKCANLLGETFKTVLLLTKPDDVRISSHGYKEFNPCINWNDIMPISTRLGVDLRFESGFTNTWSAEHYNHISDYDVEYTGVDNQSSPQRALAICCVKLLEQK